MSQPAVFRRAGAWVERLLHAGPRATPPPIPVATAPTAEPAPAVLSSEPVPTPAVDAAVPPAPAPPVPTSAADPCPAALESAHRAGRRLAEAHRWGQAQRALERAARAAPGGPVAADLTSIRAVRRQLRVLAKWPRDAAAQLALGRAYFDLGLGADAEQAFRRAVALAPAEPAGHVFLTLEYAYRGDLAAAERRHAAAQARGAGLPPLASLLAELAGGSVGAGGAGAETVAPARGNAG